MHVTLLYEYLDILLDMFQKLPFIYQSEENQKVIFMLREPAKYVNFIELILEEINDRLINKPLEISEWQNALICKALTSKPILLDTTKP
jgi:hypothetical protein